MLRLIHKLVTLRHGDIGNSSMLNAIMPMLHVFVLDGLA
jgi:hypothetical protein